MYKVTIFPMFAHANGGHKIERQFSTREKAVDFYFGQCEAHGINANMGLASVESGGVGHDVRITLTETINGEGEE